MLVANEIHADNTDADNADAEEAGACALSFTLSNCGLKLSRKQQQLGSSRSAAVSSRLTSAVLMKASQGRVWC